MNESRSLTDRLADELTANLTVSIVAVGLALTAFLLAPLRMTETYLLFAGNLAVFIPYTYEYWPIEYSPAYAAVWTIAAGLVTAGLFIGVYTICLPVLSSGVAGVVAFAVTTAVQYGVAINFPRIY